jgi:hypothetical protein
MRMVAGVVALVALAAADSRDGAFTFAVLRRDGIAVPFATFDGRRWAAHWPRPAIDLTVPIDVGSVPSSWWGPIGPPASWQAWTAAGEPQPVQVTRPDWIDVHCVRQVGLRTDYRASQFPPPPAEQPYPKDGLAIAPPHPVEPVQSVPPAAAELAAISTVLHEAFNRAERKTLDRFNHPVKEAVREQMAPAVERVYAHGGDPRVYYVESVREYAKEETRECALVSYGTGWFVREGGTFRPLSMLVDVLNCDRRGASYMLPLGVARLGTRVFWLAQFSGWDHERYVVIEPRARAVEALVSVWGGGC